MTQNGSCICPQSRSRLATERLNHYLFPEENPGVEFVPGLGGTVAKRSDLGSVKITEGAPVVTSSCSHKSHGLRFAAGA